MFDAKKIELNRTIYVININNFIFEIRSYVGKKNKFIKKI
jgi:hypothetical protein